MLLIKLVTKETVTVQKSRVDNIVKDLLDKEHAKLVVW